MRKKLKANTTCSAFPPDCGYNNNTIVFNGHVYFRNRKCSGKFCLHKRTFQSLGESEYQCPQCASVCEVRNILFEEQTNSLLLSFSQGAYIYGESPKSIEDVVGVVFCAGKYCLIRESCESLDDYVTTPRSINGCGKWWAGLFGHKVPFILQEHL